MCLNVLPPLPLRWRAPPHQTRWWGVNRGDKFKAQAVRLVLEDGRSVGAIARNLDLTVQCFRNRKPVWCALDVAPVVREDRSRRNDVAGLGGTMTGTIRTLRTDKGFGFIKDGAGKEYFFHQSAVQGEGINDLREGDSVEFEVGDGPKGPRAEKVRRTST